MRVDTLDLVQSHARPVEHDRDLKVRIVYRVYAKMHQKVVYLISHPDLKTVEPAVYRLRIEFAGRHANAERVPSESSVSTVLSHVFYDPV